MLKTIKMVDDATWARFKGLAARKGTTMGALLRTMVSEYEQSSNDFWETILEGEKILSEGEAAGMKKAVVRLRKDYGFRA